MRTLAIALALTLLAACGFEPVHGQRSSGTTYAGLEAIDVVVTDRARLSQLLQAELEDQLNPDYISVPKRYTLSITLTEELTTAFLNPDGTSSRNDVALKSTYVLTPINPGTPPHSGRITRVSSYNVSDRADYATYVAEQDARKRSILELANAYKLRMAGLMAELEK